MNWGSDFVFGRYTNELGFNVFGRHTNELGFSFFLGRHTNELEDIRMNWGSGSGFGAGPLKTRNF